jgi:hypothetical protein
MLRAMTRAALRTLVLLTLLLGAAALLASGCGSDEPRTLSKREYIEQANGLQKEAAQTFAQLEGRTVATPATAKAQLLALDRLIAGFTKLDAPAAWRDEHAALVASLQTMRQSMAVVARASRRNTKAIRVQLGRYAAAQRDFEAAVREINASR